MVEQYINQINHESVKVSLEEFDKNISSYY